MYNNTAKQQDIEERTFCEIGITLIKNKKKLWEELMMHTFLEMLEFIYCEVSRNYKVTITQLMIHLYV
jgi:hypothetical protein